MAFNLDPKQTAPAAPEMPPKKKKKGASMPPSMQGLQMAVGDKGC